MFLVYNEGATPAGKPDIEVGYTLSRGDGGEAVCQDAEHVVQRDDAAG